MDERIKKLKGSPSRDAFKHWHKTLDKKFYATDLDFVLVNKNPPGIVAIVDYKENRDSITFSEVIAYNEFVKKGISIYIVQRSSLSHKHLDIYKYINGDWKPFPPKCELTLVAKRLNVQEFEAWERKLREQYGHG